MDCATASEARSPLPNAAEDEPALPAQPDVGGYVALDSRAHNKHLTAPAPEFERKVGSAVRGERERGRDGSGSAGQRLALDPALERADEPGCPALLRIGNEVDVGTIWAGRWIEAQRAASLDDVDRGHVINQKHEVRDAHRPEPDGALAVPGSN